jgi:endonuclease YncB( thermonuclease family)
MRNWRKRQYGRRSRRRLVGWRGRSIVLAIIGLIASLAYFRGLHRGLPAIVAGPATVIDGDSLSIAGWRIRLQGIDAPEWEQTCTDASGAAWACGRSAARELGLLIKGASLTCEPSEFDRYDRVLAVCALPDGTDVNAWLVRQGWAVAFGRSRHIASAEAEAKAAKRGLWAGTFERPSDWRQRKPQ